MSIDLETRLTSYRDTLDAAIADDLQSREHAVGGSQRRTRSLLAVASVAIVAIGVAAIAVVALVRTSPPPEADSAVLDSAVGTVLPGTVGSVPSAPSATAEVIPSHSSISPPDDSAGDSPMVAVVLAEPLESGSTGGEVKLLQERLLQLGYVVGPPDGVFDSRTEQAVWAFEKLVVELPSDQPTGVVTQKLWDLIAITVPVAPRRSRAGDHVEIYLPEQVLIVFDDLTPVFISHISSGTNEQWCEEVTIQPGEYNNRDGSEPLVRGECGVSNTPGGVFSIYRTEEGVREGGLGAMFNPAYFNYQVTVHGAADVPLTPASRGAVRIPLDSSEQFLEIVALGDGVFVWDGIEEPEVYGSPPPTFNWVDPDYEIEL